jgi:hypothetical protein
MDILGNVVLQFIITSSIALIALLCSVLSLWFGIRRQVEIPLLHETLTQKMVDPSHEDAKAILTKLHLAPDNEQLQFLTLVIFKLSNSGRVPITLTDATKPVFIAFRRRTILDCQEIEKDPEELDYTYQLDGDKILLVLPLLKPKESVTLQVLVTGYVFGFPDIDVRVPQKTHFAKVNNIKRSREMLILGIIYLCAAIYLFVAGRSIPSFIFQGWIWLSFLGGLWFVAASWADRRSPPYHHMLPSQYLLALALMLIFALPVLIPLGLLALFVYHQFGTQALADMYLIIMMIFTIFGLWVMTYEGIKKLLTWRKKTYNRVLIGFLAGIPSLAFLAMCVSVLIEIFKRG